MKLSIIIVSWNVKQYLEQCLQSLYKYYNFDFEVIVVDNASTDNTVEFLRTNFPAVKLIVNSANQGFARANNQGAALAQGENLLFLNPDTEFIDDQSLPAALAYLASAPEVKLVGWQVLNPDRRNQVAVRPWPTLYSQIITLLKLNNLWPRLNQSYHAQGFDYTQTQAVDSVLGACLLMRRADFLEFKGFDEAYHIWFEEVDLCRRIWDKGGKVMYYSKARIIHYGGQSFRQVLTRARQKIFNRSLLIYWRRYQPRWQLYALYFFLPLNYLLTSLQGILRIRKNDYPTTK